MVDAKPKDMCCGCGACMHSCPEKAISMVRDEKGFAYPVIDERRCTRCNICDQVCAFRPDYRNYGDAPDIYAAKHKDDAVRETSTSGGMFTALSDEILRRGGSVYGAAFDENMAVRHERADTSKGRDRFRGSKYVQSDTGNTFAEVRADLEAGLYVLYSGTPCQTAAIKSYIGGDHERLYTVDFVCHGTPSGKMWRQYLDVIEKNTGAKVVGANFRSKERSWHWPVTRLYFDGERPKKVRGEQSYFQLFNPNYMLMPACYNCFFANYRRVSDITIGDFWGIGKCMPDFDDHTGVSLVLVNSPKGRALFDSVASQIAFRASRKEDCRQGQLTGPGKKNKKCDAFWSDYFKRGMPYILIKYTEYSAVRTFYRKAVRKIKRMLGVGT